MSTAAQIWAVVAAALGASIVTSAGALLVAGFQARKAAAQGEARRTHELEIARREDERRLRDAKAARIRDTVVVLALAADTFEAVGKQLGFRRAAETEEAHVERLNEFFAKNTDGLGPAVMRLQLEPGMEEAVETYKNVSKAFHQVQGRDGDDDADAQVHRARHGPEPQYVGDGSHHDHRVCEAQARGTGAAGLAFCLLNPRRRASE